MNLQHTCERIDRIYEYTIHTLSPLLTFVRLFPYHSPQNQTYFYEPGACTLNRTDLRSQLTCDIILLPSLNLTDFKPGAYACLSRRQRGFTGPP